MLDYNKKELSNIQKEIGNLNIRQAFIEGKNSAIVDVKLMLEAAEADHI